MKESILLIPVIAPVCAGLLLFFMRRLPGTAAWIAAMVAGADFLLGAWLKWAGSDIVLNIPWTNFGLDFLLRYYHFSGFIFLATGGFAFLIALYGTSFLKGKDYAHRFLAYLLITLSMVNGAVLADNILLMLFFWEGLLATLFAMIAIGGKDSFLAATRAFLIVGFSDLCMMCGIALAAHLSSTFVISKMSVSVGGTGTLAFILLAIGAAAKAGAMPFHSWIPDAAQKAPLPFMAFLPASLEKLLGIYFLARVTLDIFRLTADSWLSTLLMVVGATTILLAVMMALVQKEYKKLLSYHAISQVGYMILGIGTAVPAGIIGGLFHMVNHAIYKSCLFLTAGSVERSAGTTDLAKLGGLWRAMPATFACFVISAASISGVPPFNGFFSKELVYEAALQRGAAFYVVALMGSFFTAASFLKLGHAAFLGKRGGGMADTKESPAPMLIPMVTLAGLCVVFGVMNYLPLNAFIRPIAGEGAAGSHQSPAMLLYAMTGVVLIGAVINHINGVRFMGSGLKAVDHIYNTRPLFWMYKKAEGRLFDPYYIMKGLISAVAVGGYWCDRTVDRFFEKAVPAATARVSQLLRNFHSGNIAGYIMWSILGMILVMYYVLR
ncbi:MAG TPA: proton-conducting transporter membrane subunit [Spirochaetota bacterium]|nr:proton-conducting transporter membrane subunit [Spirochaetota bacterium]